MPLIYYRRNAHWMKLLSINLNLKYFTKKAHIVLLSKEANNSPNYLAILIKHRKFKIYTFKALDN
ncbi:hypothetical protein T12_10774 [Trichinella patagoniensis]|uniref:Uncharacterized protein n=1 Tax=Trichinella patagoniensis TaxID=990121 RepID=A0A0V1ADX8_9BILA|nr:hypothetical protein T12_10774 [Trichinella patagoniensis]